MLIIYEIIIYLHPSTTIRECALANANAKYFIFVCIDKVNIQMYLRSIYLTTPLNCCTFYIYFVYKKYTKVFKNGMNDSFY